MISFLIGANPFSRVCPFHFYDICNRHELISECANGKKEKIADSGGVK